jgi:hypothetical protein
MFNAEQEYQGTPFHHLPFCSNNIDACEDAPGMQMAP